VNFFSTKHWQNPLWKENCTKSYAEPSLLLSLVVSAAT